MRLVHEGSRPFTACVEKAFLTAKFAPEAKGDAVWGLTVRKSEPRTIVRDKDVSVTGKLPPEVVRRIVRSRFGQLRACFEQGLKKKPDLAGTFVVDGEIDAKGNPQFKEGGSTLPDKAATACMSKVFAGLAFPEPESGTVKVHYGLTFSHELQ